MLLCCSVVGLCVCVFFFFFRPLFAVARDHACKGDPPVSVSFVTSRDVICFLLVTIQNGMITFVASSETHEEFSSVRCDRHSCSSG